MTLMVVANYLVVSVSPIHILVFTLSNSCLPKMYVLET